MLKPLTDRHSRTHRSLRISIVDKCDLRCTYCMPEDQHFLKREELMTREEIATIARLFVERYGITKVRLTGGEPLLRPDAVDIVRDMSRLGVSLGITTNALSLDKHLDGLIDAGLKNINISLDTFDAERFRTIARRDGFECYALSFDYGQRHRVELDCARKVAAALGAREHAIAQVDLRWIGGSALTSAIDVPKHRSASEMGAGIPVTYVPARNTIFLSYALAWSEVLGASDIFIGVNAVDYSGYPDCRPEYIESFEKMANLATKAGVEGSMSLRVHTPLAHASKAEIIRMGLELGVDYGLTHSCYDPAADGRPCGACDSCLLRRRGFAEAGLEDPLSYVHL